MNIRSQLSGGGSSYNGHGNSSSVPPPSNSSKSQTSETDDGEFAASSALVSGMDSDSPLDPGSESISDLESSKSTKNEDFSKYPKLSNESPNQDTKSADSKSKHQNSTDIDDEVVFRYDDFVSETNSNPNNFFSSNYDANSSFSPEVEFL